MLNVEKLVNEVLAPELESAKEEQLARKMNNWYLSGFGLPLIGRYLARLEVEPDIPISKRVIGIFDQGSRIEDWIVDKLKRHPDVIVETQGRVEHKDLHVSGRWDLMLTDKKTGEKFLFEIKSKHSKAFWYMLGSKRFSGKGAPLHNKLQLWGYLMLTGVEKGSLVYFSRDDGAYAQFPIYRNDEVLKKIFFEELLVLNYCWDNKLCPPLPTEDFWWNYSSYSKAFCEDYVSKNKSISESELKVLTS